LFKPYEVAVKGRYKNDIADIWLAKKNKPEEVDKKNFSDCFHGVPKYIIEKRGISIETCRAWQIGYWKRGKQGVFFPIYDNDDRFVGYSIRWIFPRDDEASYFHMPGLKRNKILYGENMIDEKRSEKYVIVEGPIDALKVWQAGYNALSPIGGSFSDGHVSKIMNIVRHLDGIVMGDGDKAGRALSDDVYNKLSERKLRIRKVDMPSGKDPADCSEDEIRKLVG
jgi:DNA primase